MVVCLFDYRPHYHYIVFGLKLDDLCLYKNNALGDALYTSNELQRCWTDENGIPLGYITVGSVTTDSAGYCARYALKKQKMTLKEDYAKLGIDPEFVVMSRRPGLGKNYFDDHYEELYLTDEIILPGRDKAVHMKPPKYYDTLLEKLDPELLQDIKLNRRSIAESHENYINDYLPFLDREEIYKAKERKLQNNTVILKRRNLDG